jgi:ketosteroid isomerase-like protein
MRNILFGAVVAVLVMASGAAAPRDDFKPEDIINLERGALERWANGDPDGYFEIMAPEVTYFDPSTERRIDGLNALKAMIAPFRGKIHIDREELVDPKVQRIGDVAVLTLNIISHGGRLGDGPKRDTHWNTTEVYRLINGRWRIVHSHFSYTKSGTI